MSTGSLSKRERRAKSSFTNSGPDRVLRRRFSPKRVAAVGLSKSVSRATVRTPLDSNARNTPRPLRSRPATRAGCAKREVVDWLIQNASRTVKVVVGFWTLNNAYLSEQNPEKSGCSQSVPNNLPTSIRRCKHDQFRG